MKKRLNELDIGEKAKVIGLLSTGIERRRMLDLGIVCGTEIESVQKSPAGDPIAYCIRGTLIALRSEDANKIEICVEKCDHNKNNEKTVALAGNPNVGKSTVFNSLTGMNQHTGNWPGKTVANARGKYQYNNKIFNMVDIPGTYSLMPTSAEEEVARDFICYGKSDCVVVVADATCLERNLNLVIQVLEIRKDVILCVNLLDEAKKKNIEIDLDELSLQLGIPVVGTSARSGKGLEELKNEIENITFQKKKTFGINVIYNNTIEEVLSNMNYNSRWCNLRELEETDEKYKDEIVSTIVLKAEEIYKKCVLIKDKCYNSRDRKIDKILTSKKTGIPIMILLLAIIFFITITGANYPSEILSTFLFGIQDNLSDFLTYIQAPEWVNGIFVLGMYRTLAWVVSVMLPPMAIFFPLFTLLEDSGYLPRIAFNLDKFFKRSGAHGKQALTMCMGFGCNACGIVGCRIIDSPRERLIATITNNFVPCNGRFPTLITIITIFFTGAILGPIFSPIASTLLLTGVIILGVFMTFLISKILSKTLLKGIPSSFVLELPSYRTPQFGKVIIRSIFDRTLFVLGRAVVIAAPAGIVIWIMANIYVGDISILSYCANFLDPFARVIGLDGVILMAFILGFPANEIVIPIIIMTYMCTGSIMELSNLEELRQLLISNGWTWLTAICVMLFSLMHFPCGTTCFTIKKETGSLKWTAISFLIPTIVGITVCFIVTSIVRIFNLV